MTARRRRHRRGCCCHCRCRCCHCRCRCGCCHAPYAEKEGVGSSYVTGVQAHMVLVLFVARHVRRQPKEIAWRHRPHARRDASLSGRSEDARPRRQRWCTGVGGNGHGGSERVGCQGTPRAPAALPPPRCIRHMPMCPMAASEHSPHAHVPNGAPRGLHADSSCAHAQVSLEHLVSYEHMGIATVRCVGSCSCAVQIINAHRTDAHRNVSVFLQHAFDMSYSLPATAAASVASSAAECALQALAQRIEHRNRRP